MPRITIKRAAFYSTALIVFLVLLAPFILEPIVNFPRVQHEIFSLIRQKTGVEIDQDEIDIVFLPRPGLRFKDTTLSFGDMVQLDIGAISADIDTAKLMEGKFAVSKILIETPRIRYTPPKILQEPAVSGLPFNFRFPKKEIQKLFALFPDSQDTLELKISNIKTDYFDAMDGSFFVSKTHQTMIFTATIQGLDLKKKQFPESAFFQEIDVDAFESDDIKIAMKLDVDGTLTGTLLVNSPRVLANQTDTPLVCDVLDFNFQFSRENLSVALKPVVFSSPHERVGTVGVNFTDDTKAAKTAITFVGDDIDIAQARKVCLNLAGSNEVVTNLFDILRGGTAREITVGFTSKTLATLFDGENLLLTGSAENSLVKIPETPLMVQKVHGDALLEKGVLHIKARQGQVRGTRIKEGWLDIDLMNYEDFPFKGEFNLQSDLSTLPGVLISLLPGTVLSRELARVGEVVGKTDALLKLGMESMQKDLFVQVRAKNLSIKGIYDRIPMPITITQGSFFYEAETVVLKNFSGSLRGSSIKNLNAEIDIGSSPRFDLNSGPVRIDLSQIMDWLNSYDPVMALMSPVKNTRGQIVVDRIKLDGPIFEPDKWRFDMNGSGKDINIGYSRGREKTKKAEIKSVSGRFNLTHERVALQGVKLRVEDLSWLSHAIETHNLESVELPLNIFEAGFNAEKGKAQFQGRLSFPSGPVLSFDLTGKNIETLYPRLLMLKDEKNSDAMVMFNKDPSKPWLRFEGNLNTKTLEKIFIKDSFLYNFVTSFTAGGPVKIFTDKASRIHLDTDKINLDSFLATENRKEKTNVQPLVDYKTLYLTTRQLTYKKIDFLNIDSKINFKKDKTQIQIRNANLCNLTAIGMVELAQDKVTTNFSILPQGNQENLSDILPCLFDNQNIIDGTYTFTCSLSGQASSNAIANRQNGTLTLNAKNGRIYKWTFLSRILSVLNILHAADITKKGIGYRTIVIEADIRDSIVYLKKGVIDADNMALIFKGWIDPLNDKMDLTCLVAPFKTIDTIIKFIPIVNTLLSGRLVAFPAKATGSITDPSVTALHPSAVGKGLMNMLEDIIKTPVRLFQKE